MMKDVEEGGKMLRKLLNPDSRETPASLQGGLTQVTHNIC